MTVPTLREIQYAASMLYERRQSAVSEYIALGGSFGEADRAAVPEYMRNIKVAFLSSFTIQGLPEVFRTACLFNNVWADTYSAPYNQFTQEIVNKESALYRFDPALCFLIIDTKDIADDAHLELLVARLRAETTATIVIFNFIPDVHESEDRKSVRFSETLNEKIKTAAQKKARVFVYDLQAFLARSGRDEIWNTKYAALGDLRIHPDAFPALAYDISRWAIAVAGATKKCVILDLDDTLWAGIAGEEGPAAVVPNRALQTFLLDLSKKGILLAVNSKNNINDAMEVLEHHPDMLLRTNDFANLKINWDPKDGNIAAIARELRLGTDSFAFVDDSSFERDVVRTVLPEVAVIAPEKLSDYPGFHTLGVTAEDIRRGEMYREEGARKALESSVASVDDFLRTLELEVAITAVVLETIPRVSQLTQKTNQFNVTTRRYSEADIAGKRREGWHIWSVSARDRFGEYGIIGVCMVEPLGDTWRIDTLLLSCRILGRKIENIVFVFLCNEAERQGVKKIIGEFIPTQKNAPAATFFPSVGFRLAAKDGVRETYEYTLGLRHAYPDFIKVLC